MEIRSMISTRLERGKVEFSLWTESNEEHTASPINGEASENQAQRDVPKRSQDTVLFQPVLDTGDGGPETFPGGHHPRSKVRSTLLAAASGDKRLYLTRVCLYFLI